MQTFGTLRMTKIVSASRMFFEICYSIWSGQITSLDLTWKAHYHSDVLYAVLYGVTMHCNWFLSLSPAIPLTSWNPEVKL